jgi:hypothetical protein
MFVDDLPLVKASVTGGDYSIYSILHIEQVRLRVLFAISETFGNSTLVARDLFNGKVTISKYEQIPTIDLCSSASIIQQVKKIYQLHDVVTITEYDYPLDTHNFFDKWFHFLGKPLYKHSKREILDALKSTGYNTTVRSDVNTINTNPLYKYYIDCSKIDSAKAP